ncbi:hypothetical protein HOU41_gp016 [Proteus phage Stubb]|uniref:Uncharacterized protein n=1 Tax=Proteus phage Stubb TaxID=2315597 RepID=A0A3B8DIZ4_9CAUD|nr:hypothetical protein HOU41_gp016 [Proteus phage Stubb]AYJ73156.1 hypothetical protein CPT_Stubb_016 [Proteus phage Stubb]
MFLFLRENFSSSPEIRETCFKANLATTGGRFSKPPAELSGWWRTD